MRSFIKKIVHFLFDIFGSIPLLINLPILYWHRKFNSIHLPIQWKLLKFFGVYVIRDHYYEPKFVYDKAFDASKERALPISTDIAEQLNYLSQLTKSTELAKLEINKSVNGNYYINNSNFGAGDAELYYLLIRDKKPKRIIEIGSGFSTLLGLLAIEKNRAEGFDCQHTCIEPFEMPFLEKLAGIHLIRQTVESVPLDLFQSLEANDILFIDSSHIIRPGDDLLFIYFQILPILQKGVLIHIHDIFTPRHYPQEWLTKKMRFWNEQYLLEAFLYNNSGFKILFTLNHLVKTDFAEAKKVLIHLEESSEPSSFWMERV